MKAPLPLSAPQPSSAKWINDIRLNGQHNDFQRYFVLNEFLARNFKSPNGALSASLSNPHQLEALLAGLGEQYNHIVGTDPKTGTPVTVMAKKVTVKDQPVIKYYPTFGPGVFEACLVMRLKGVTEYEAPAVLTDIHGVPSPMEGRWGIKRREFVENLLRVGIPVVSMEENDYAVVASAIIRGQLRQKDIRLSKLCLASSTAYSGTQQHKQQDAAPTDLFMRTFHNLMTDEDKLHYLEILCPNLSKELRQSCVASGNLDKIIDQYYYVSFLLLQAGLSLGQSESCSALDQVEHHFIMAISDYCQALRISTDNKALQVQACEGLSNLKDRLVKYPHCPQWLVRALCDVMPLRGVYDIEMLKKYLLNPFGLKELFSKNACHRPAPWKVQGYAPRFVMSMLHKVDSVTREYSCDTAEAYLAIIAEEPSFSALQRQLKEGTAPAAIKDLMRAIIVKHESPLPDYLANQHFNEHLAVLASLIPEFAATASADFDDSHKLDL